MFAFKQINEQRPFLLPTAIFSLFLLLFIIGMNLYFPQEGKNEYNSFIIAFEFAESVPELNSLFEGFNAAELRKIDTGNYIDFGFMLCYSVLIGFLFVKSAKVFKRKWLYFGLLFSILVFAADFTENLLLLNVTEIYLNQDNEILLTSLMEKLNKVTWLKWSGLAFTFFVFYAVLLRLKWIYKIAGLLLTFPLLFILVTRQFTPGKISIFTTSIFISYFVLIFFGLSFKRKLSD